MKYTYIPKGVCPRAIEFEIEDNTVRNVRYTGGCNGNLQALGRLVEGMKVEDVVSKLEGTHCGMKKTSCADQLVAGLKEAIEKAAQ